MLPDPVLQAALEKEPEPNGAGTRPGRVTEGSPFIEGLVLRASSLLGVTGAGSRRDGKAVVQSKREERERHTSLEKVAKGPVQAQVPGARLGLCVPSKHQSSGNF